MLGNEEAHGFDSRRQLHKKSHKHYVYATFLFCPYSALMQTFCISALLRLEKVCFIYGIISCFC